MSADSDSRLPSQAERASWILAAAAAATLVVNARLGSGSWGGLLVVLHPILLALTFAALLMAIRARLARRAAEQPPSSSASRLFDDGEESLAQPLSEARALNRFDYLVGWMAAPFLTVIQVMGVLAVTARLREKTFVIPDVVPWDAVIALGVEAFVFFVAGRCLLTWSRTDSAPGLRLAGQYAGMACAVCLASASAFVLPVALRQAAFSVLVWGAVAVLGLAAAESAFRGLASFYRPAGQDRVRLWDENLVAGFFAEPSSWWRRFCESLDYQFGFAVSRTQAFRVLIRSMIPGLLSVGLLLYASSALVLLNPEEAAVRERFGRPVTNEAVLGPGFHLVRPWPFETVRRFPVGRIQSFTVGVRLEPGEEPPRVILWDVPHYREEEYVLVAGRRDPGIEESGRAVPANLLVMSIPVEFMVTNLHQFLYGYADPAGVLIRLAARTVTLKAASRDLFGFFGHGQLATADSLRKTIQAESDRLRLGVSVLFVGLQEVHPPVPVAPAFQQVVGAVEEREARVWTAHGYARRLLPLAQARADARLHDARAASYRRVALAAAEADLFRARVRSEAEAPVVFRARQLLDTLDAGLGRARKILVTAAPGREVVSLNLESRLSRDLFDFVLGTNSLSGDTRP